MDFTLIDEAANGTENALILTDVFSKFGIAATTRNQKASTVAQVRKKEQLLFYKYGPPLRLHSDQGINFESDVVMQNVQCTEDKNITLSP